MPHLRVIHEKFRIRHGHSGTIGVSSLAYISPRLIYMAMYGEELLALVNETWEASSPPAVDYERKPLESLSVMSNR
jgi:hypothetical protein